MTRSSLHRRLTAIEAGRVPKVSAEMIGRLAAEFDNRMLRLAASFDEADANISDERLADMSLAMRFAHTLRFGGPALSEITHDAGRTMP